MPNAFAYLVFWSWPLVTAGFFSRFRLETALTLTIVAGYLFVPGRVSLNLPGLPTFDKHLVPALAALVFCLLNQQRDLPGRAAWRALGWLPQSLWARLCLALFVLGPIGTVLTNGDPVAIGETILPGLGLYDIGNLVNNNLAAILPFLLARRYLGSEAAQVTVLKIFLVLGLIYSVLVIIEWRLSPFLNEMIYGFRPAHWNQLARGDGFRPVVFLNHGLWTVIVTLKATLAAAALWRITRGQSNRPLLMAATVWMVITLVLSNSLGALLIGILLVPATMMMADARRLAMAVTISWIVLLYPTLRSTDQVPTTEIVQTLRDLGPNFRAGSLEYRFEHEDMLLARANQRPVFGWGGWGRNRVHNEEGEDISVTDGRWIIVFGVFGWVGYIGEYGLLTLPMMLLYRRRRQVGTVGASIGIAMMLSANLIDILPNASLTPLSWLLAGAILGRAEIAVMNPVDTAGKAKTQDPPRGLRSATNVQAGNRPAPVFRATGPIIGGARMADK